MSIPTRKLGDTYWCPKCRTYKAREAFGNNKNSPHGVEQECRECHNRKKRKYADANARFWAKFRERTREENGCSVWYGRRSSDIPVMGWHGVKAKSVRRIVYQLARADVPDDMFVEMTCGNKWCVKVSHMQLITQEQRDIKRANSAPTGDRHHTHLYPERVIRGDRHYARVQPERLARGDNHGSRLHPERLARGDRNGSRIHPERLRRGEQHPARMHPERVVRGEAHPGAKLTEDAVRSIRQRYALGNITQRLLAIEYGVSDMLIRNVIRRKAWAHVE